MKTLYLLILLAQCFAYTKAAEPLLVTAEHQHTTMFAQHSSFKQEIVASPEVSNQHKYASDTPLAAAFMFMVLLVWAVQDARKHRRVKLPSFTLKNVHQRSTRR